MLFSFLGCTEPPSGTWGDSGSLSTLSIPDPSTDDSGSGSGSGDDSGTDDSATDDSGDDTGPKPWLVPDFALVDLNTSSPTYGHTISPREHKGHVSGWYFIHAT